MKYLYLNDNAYQYQPDIYYIPENHYWSLTRPDRHYLQSYYSPVTRFINHPQISYPAHRLTLGYRIPQYDIYNDDLEDSENVCSCHHGKKSYEKVQRYHNSKDDYELVDEVNDTSSLSDPSDNQPSVQTLADLLVDLLNSKLKPYEAKKSNGKLESKKSISNLKSRKEKSRRKRNRVSNNEISNQNSNSSDTEVNESEHSSSTDSYTKSRPINIPIQDLNEPIQLINSSDTNNEETIDSTECPIPSQKSDRKLSMIEQLLQQSQPILTDNINASTQETNTTDNETNPTVIQKQCEITPQKTSILEKDNLSMLEKLKLQSECILTPIEQIGNEDACIKDTIIAH
ncbi:hypothetical protein BC833DRAFT_568998 [Globomyces pollinis-pini]|nr:hypothetical protein BC833DRAFT_568998 [Globomyces pollinis-pini]